MTKKTIVRITIAVIVCLLVGFLASVATQSSVHNWYLSLEKPFFTPPNYMFMPIWTLLYITMGIAAGLVWSKGFYHKWVKTALYHFGFQLILNGAWSVIFFGLKTPFLALIIILVLFIVLFFTYKWFKIVDQKAAYFLIPYIAWVGFAVILNFEIWRLNI